MNKTISYTDLTKYLTRATFVYLIVPYIIFFFGWLHWWMALLMAVICVLPLVWDWKRADTSTSIDGQKNGTTVWQIGMVCGMALLFILLSGIGGWGWQTIDWAKHNMLLRDLVEQPWPLMYQLDAVQLPLVYYFAYYLPAALIGKFFGWVAANHALLIESWFGLSLVFLWGVVLIKRSWWKAALLVGGFAGMDILGYLLLAPVRSMFLEKATNLSDFEWWAIGWNYLSFDRILFWTPNQGFAGWLAMALILNEMFSHQRKYTLWYLALTTFWSPFITVGILPFVLADWASEPYTLPAWMRKYALPNLCGVLLGGLIGLMYVAKFYPLPPEVSGRIVSIFFFSLTQDSVEAIAAFILLILFWLFECGLYGILAWKLLDREDKRSRLILAVSLIVLGLLPFYQYGYYNDLLQKASIPALFALSIIVGRVALDHAGKRRTQLVLIILLVIGFITASVNVGIQVGGILKTRALWHLPPASEVSTIWELQKKEEENAFKIEGMEYTSFISQYIGSGEAPFFQWFVRQ